MVINTRSFHSDSFYYRINSDCIQFMSSALKQITSNPVHCWAGATHTHDPESLQLGIGHRNPSLTAYCEIFGSYHLCKWGTLISGRKQRACKTLRKHCWKLYTTHTSGSTVVVVTFHQTHISQKDLHSPAIPKDKFPKFSSLCCPCFFPKNLRLLVSLWNKCSINRNE